MIRLARPQDAETIAALHVEGWQEFSDFVPLSILRARGLSLRTTEWRQHLAAADPRWFVAVAQREEQPVGFVTVEHLAEPAFEARSEIHHLFVTRAWRRHGVGRRLLASAADWIESRQAEPISLFSFTQNAHRAAYARLGGQIVGERASAWDGLIIAETCYLWPSATLLRRFVTGEPSRTADGR